MSLSTVLYLDRHEGARAARIGVDVSGLGKWVFFLGAGLAVFGLLLWLAGKAGLPLGRLPGDVRIEGGRHSFYLPIVTCIIISAVLTLVLNVLIRLFRR